MSDSHEGRMRSDSADVAYRKIFIGGLSYSTDEEKLKKYFKAYGAVQDAVVMKDPISKRSRGFGFITFYDTSSVDSVLDREPHVIDSRKVEAKRAVPRTEMISSAMPSMGLSSKPPPSSPQISSRNGSISSVESSPLMSVHQFDSKYATDPRLNMEEYAYNKIFVGGLHYDTRDAEFRAYFESFGRIMSAEVMFNRETHKSRGFGFVVFDDEAGAERVCAEKEHVISGKVVEVKRAIPRSKLPPSAAGASEPPEGGSPQNSAVMRRRTLSGGNAQAIGVSPVILSGNSSTLTSTAQKQASAKRSPGTSNNISSPSSTVMGKAGSSYAAAVLMGGAPTSGGFDGSRENFISPGHNIADLGMMFPSLVQSSPLLESVRPNRAQSEPIARYEGSSALNGELLLQDFNGFPSHNVGVIQPSSSNNSSRSSSIVGPPGGLSSHLPWLSSPSTVPFESSISEDHLPLNFQLPPAANVDKSDGSRPSYSSSPSGNIYSTPAGIASESHYGVSSHAIFSQGAPYLPAGKSTTASEQDDGSPFFLPPFRGPFLSSSTASGTLMGNRARSSSLNALCTVTPSPEVWASFVQQSSGNPSLVPPSRSLLGDTSWEYRPSTSLFDSAASSSSFQDTNSSSGMGGDDVSRILSMAQSHGTQQISSIIESTPPRSLHSSNTTEDLKDGSFQKLSDLRLDSPEYDPMLQKWRKS